MNASSNNGIEKQRNETFCVSKWQKKASVRLATKNIMPNAYIPKKVCIQKERDKKR